MKKTMIIFVLLLSLATGRAQDYSTVYLIGAATPGGWDLSSASKMSAASEDEAIFTWEGHLKKDEFKFISNKDWFWPGFLATVNGEKVEAGKTYNLRYSKDMIDEDYKFIPAEEGDYKITVNLKTLRMSVERGREQILPEELWIEGTAVPGGKQKLILTSKGAFNYNGQLKKGTLRVTSAEIPGENTVYYVPSWEDPDVQDGSPIVQTTDAQAPGYWVEVPSDYYRIRLNLNSLELTAAPFRAPYTLYIVGGATKAGWNVQDAISFTQDLDNPYLYTGRAELMIRKENTEANLFKILGQPDWGPYSLHPSFAGQPVTEADYVVENGDDTKWSVPEDKQGWYKLDVDLWNGTIKGEMQTRQQGIAPIGLDNTIDATTVKETRKSFSIKADNGSVVVDAKEMTGNARLVSLSGNTIATAGAHGTRTVLGRNLAQGVYVVVLADNESGETYVQKVSVR